VNSSRGKDGFGGKCDLLPETGKAGTPMALWSDASGNAVLAIGNCRDRSKKRLPTDGLRGAPPSPSDSIPVIGPGGDVSENSGAVHVFRRYRTGSGEWKWKLDAYIKSVNSQEGDLFGASVALRGDFLVVGSPGEKYTDDDGIEIENAGAVYAYRYKDSKWQATGARLSLNHGEANKAKDQYFGASVAIPFLTGKSDEAAHPIFVGDGEGRMYYDYNAWTSALTGASPMSDPLAGGRSFPTAKGADSMAVGYGLMVFGDPDRIFIPQDAYKEGPVTRGRGWVITLPNHILHRLSDNCGVPSCLTPQPDR